MLLPPQSILRPHRCSIFRFSESRAASGKPNAHTGSTVATGVPCRFQTGESVHTPEGFVLAEQDNMFTLDLIHFNADADVQSGDVLKQTTGPDAGRYFEVRGDDKKRTQYANKLSLRASRLEKAPAWVPA